MNPLSAAASTGTSSSASTSSVPPITIPVSTATSAVTPTGFDEIFTSTGRFRSAWRHVGPFLEERSCTSMEKFKESSVKSFHGDNMLMPIPRMLTTTKNKMLRQAVRQRGRALHAFLVDHYDGPQRYLSNGWIPRPVMHNILKRTHEENLRGIVNTSTMGFWYGPDIIRGPGGRFHIVEDNPGYVGGMGDLVAASKTMFGFMPQMRSLVEAPNPKSFYASMASRYTALCRGGGSTLVYVCYSKRMASDNEEQRLKRIFAENGIHTVYLPQGGVDQRYTNRLVVKKSGVFLRRRGSTDKKVGFIISGVESADLDPTDASVYLGNLRRALNSVRANIDANIAKTSIRGRSVLGKELQKVDALLADEAEAACRNIERYLRRDHSEELDSIRTSGVRGILKQANGNRVGLANGPGTEFLGDKEFYIYVDSLIEKYLGERPIVPSIRTRSFGSFGSAGSPVLNNALMQEVFTSSNYRKHVVKQVGGRGGSEVWVGAFMDQWSDFAALAPQIRKSPSSFIVQDYVPLSQVNGNLCDLRYLAHVGSMEPIISPVPWGRAVRPAGSAGKVNISADGAEQTVLVAASSVRGAQSASSTRQPKRRKLSNGDGYQRFCLNRAASNSNHDASAAVDAE